MPHVPTPHLRVTLIALLALVFAAAIQAAPRHEAEEAEPLTIAEATEGAEEISGLLTLFRHKETGQLRMMLRRDQFDREFIYCSHVTDTVAEAGSFRGDFHDNRIILFKRDFDRVEIVAPNTAYYFAPSSPLSRAASANRPPAILATMPIAAENPRTGDVIVDVDDLFLEEALTQVQPSIDPETDETDPKRFVLGELSEKRTHLAALRNYPENTEVVVDYVYVNPTPRVYGSPGVTDARYVTIEIQHTFLQAPENNYEPRLADPRVGFFTCEQTDMTSTTAAPYHDLIQRWNLRKRDPKAELSEPVEPITFWIENTTPTELRDFVREGALAWNTAFEAAGFKNAVEVKTQPDDAGWEAGDIRYNVIRWASSPNPQFGGFGPSFVDPRTGQILGADIMLEFVYTTNRMIEEKVFAKSPAPAHRNTRRCLLAANRQSDLIAGRTVARALDLGESAQRQLLHEAIVELVMHEVGHTLGLQHNMHGSSLHPPGKINDISVTKAIGLSSSVMD